MKHLFVVWFAVAQLTGSLAQTSVSPIPPVTEKSPVYTELSFYVIAHQDDWQLFMGTHAQNDISNYHINFNNPDNPPTGGTKVVFIYTTAGNVENNPIGIAPGDPANKRSVPYYMVREKGALNSIHLAANKQSDGWCFEPTPVTSTETIHGHQIRKYSYKNTVSYFLRTAERTFQRMALTTDGSATAVDSSATYQNWCDFVQTVNEIFTLEKNSVETAVKPSLHIPDYDRKRNPGDNLSHYFSAMAALDAAGHLDCFRTFLYVEYHSKNLPPNLSLMDIQLETGLAAAYCMALIDHHLWTEWHQTGNDANLYQDWTVRNYFTEENSCEIPPGKMHACR